MLSDSIIHRVIVDYRPLRSMVAGIMDSYPEFSEEDGYNIFEMMAWSYFDDSDTKSINHHVYKYMTNNGFPETDGEWTASERALELLEYLDTITRMHLPIPVKSDSAIGPLSQYNGVTLESVSPDYIAVLRVSHDAYLTMSRGNNVNSGASGADYGTADIATASRI